MELKIGLLGAVGAGLLLSGCATEADHPLVVPQKQGEKATIAGHRHYGAPLDVPVLLNLNKTAKVTPKDESRTRPPAATPPPQ